MKRCQEKLHTWDKDREGRSQRDGKEQLWMYLFQGYKSFGPMKKYRYFYMYHYTNILIMNKAVTEEVSQENI